MEVNEEKYLKVGERGLLLFVKCQHNIVRWDKQAQHQLHSATVR